MNAHNDKIDLNNNLLLVIKLQYYGKWHCAEKNTCFASLFILSQTAATTDIKTTSDVVEITEQSMGTQTIEAGGPEW